MYTKNPLGWNGAFKYLDGTTIPRLWYPGKLSSNMNQGETRILAEDDKTSIASRCL